MTASIIDGKNFAAAVPGRAAPHEAKLKDEHGILAQLPLPGHIDESLAINAIDPAKDVDGFHISNLVLLPRQWPARAPTQH